MMLSKIFDFRFSILDFKSQIANWKSQMACVLCLSMIVAQPMLDTEDSIKPSKSLESSNDFNSLPPDPTGGFNDPIQHQAYAALCKAVYWEQ